MYERERKKWEKTKLPKGVTEIAKDRAYDRLNKA